MRTILIAAAAGIAVLAAGNASAAPVNGAVLKEAAQAAVPTQQVHCRWYPHRHRNNIPHGWGRGCGPKPPKKP